MSAELIAMLVLVPIAVPQRQCLQEVAIHE